MLKVDRNYQLSSYFRKPEFVTIQLLYKPFQVNAIPDNFLLQFRSETVFVKPHVHSYKNKSVQKCFQTIKNL